LSGGGEDDVLETLGPEVDVSDTPVVAAVWPTVFYLRPEQRVYVYGTSFPPDPQTACVFLGSSRQRHLVGGLRVNGSLAVCQLPTSLVSDTYRVTVRFRGVGVVARAATLSTGDPSVSVLNVPNITRFRPKLVSAWRSSPVVLEGLVSQVAMAEHQFAACGRFTTAPKVSFRNYWSELHRKRLQ
jgi:hypothetical protein